MNRIVIAVILALVAVGAGAVWAIGQFGGPPPVQSAAREPVIREPQPVTTEPGVVVSPQVSAVQASPAPQGAPEPVAVPEGEPAPASEPQPAPASPALDTFRSTLQSQEEPAAKEPAADPATTPAAPEPQARDAEPRVLPQQAGVSQTPAPTGLEAQFKSRRVTYNRPPEKLALNKPVDVSLVVNATDDENAGKEALEGFKGEIVERDVDLSDTVSAQLTGVGFDISTQTVERQRLSGRTVNRWQWRVTPTEVGEHTLILEIFGYASGSLDAEPLDAYRDVITVEVEQLDQVVSWARGVQPIFAVLAALAAVGSAIFAFMRFREEKKQTKAMTSKGE